MLAQLEADGTIARHVGRGTFLASMPERQDKAAAPAAHISPAELMEARLRIEPALCRADRDERHGC
jgi:DNA-binding FadR family transcriptional regulator